MNSTISDRIRKQMEQMDGLNAEALRPLADVYSQEVDQVNARLSECAQLLRKGLRSEAIQRANMRPNVLDWSAALDFPELDDWLGILQFFGINSPTNLDRDGARQVQEAVIDEQPLEELLRQHRRMAIAKAPLPWRLKILRRLRAVDSANPVWAEDQQAWELVRLNQIPNQLTQAIATKSLDDCTELAAELASRDWLTRPSKELRRAAANAAEEISFAQQSARLQVIADQLHAAFGEGNLAAAQQEHQAWVLLISSMKRQPPIDIVQMAEPALEWLADQNAGLEKSKRHEVSTIQLQKLLDGDTKLSTLQKAYHELVNLDLGIDPTLGRRYAARIAEIELRSKRKTQFAYFAVAASVLVMMGLFGFWQWSRSNQQKLESAHSELKSMLDAERWPEAQDFLKQLESRAPKLLESPSIASLGTQLRAKVVEEASRQERFARLMEMVEIEDSSRIDLETVRAAESEARTDDEKARTAHVRRAHERHGIAIRNQQFEEVTKAIEVADAKLVKIESLSIFAINEQDLTSILNDLNQLRVAHPKAGSQADRMIGLTLQKATTFLESVHKQRQLLEKRADSIKRIQKATTMEAYRSGLEDYAQELPTDSQTADFAEALQEKALWQIPLQWNAWCLSLQGRVQGGLDADETNVIAEEFAKLKVNFRGNNALSIFPKFESELAAWKIRPELLSSLINDLESAVIADLVTVVEANSSTASGPSNATRRWFMNHDERTRQADKIQSLKSTSSIGLFVVTDENGSTSNQPFLGKPSVGEEPRALIRKIVKRCKENQSKFLLGWDTEFLAFIQDFQTSNALDHAIQLLLLPRILEAGNQGSPLLKQTFADLKDKLIEQEEIRFAWFKPRPFTADLPGDLETRLQKAIVDTQREIKASESAFNALVKSKYYWVGGLMGDSQNELKPWLAAGKPPDGQFFTIKPVAGETQVANLLQIGTIKNGQTNWNRSVADTLAGRPIFFLRDP
ncbi:MAG: hypothetical protein SGI77_00215 [Pirellulaceae bacterium]|nr:hypothetical protein [Pirellulaceae bacterium]